MARKTPMGYIKGLNDKYQVVVDETKTWIVRRIFFLALEDISARKIAKITNEEGIFTTGEKYSKEGIENDKFILSTNWTIWMFLKYSEMKIIQALMCLI